MKIVRSMFCNYATLAFMVVILDRVTKMFALGLAQEQHVLPVLSFDLVYNRGVSWGLFHGIGQWWLSIVFILSTLFIVGVLGWYAYDRIKQKKYIFGEIMIIAGALSNALDRGLYGAVVDFIQVHYHEYYFPVFNVADIAIVLGVALMLFSVWDEL